MLALALVVDQNDVYLYSAGMVDGEILVGAVPTTLEPQVVLARCQRQDERIARALEKKRAKDRLRSKTRAR
jgi:hypothetical protein